MKVNAENIFDIVYPLFDRIASPPLICALSQNIICQIVSDFSGSLSVVLASHVDRVVLALEALEDSSNSTCFQIQQISDLGVRFDGSVEVF